MRDAGGVHDADQVKLDAPGFQTLQRAGAATQHHRHQTDDELVQQTGLQALLHEAGAHQRHVLPRSGGLGLLDGALNAVGDERVGRITGKGWCGGCRCLLAGGSTVARAAAWPAFRLRRRLGPGGPTRALLQGQVPAGWRGAWDRAGAHRPAQGVLGRSLAWCPAKAWTGRW
jgi:hypothetical protein